VRSFGRADANQIKSANSSLNTGDVRGCGLPFAKKNRVSRMVGDF
jgi:hypothetical protein